MRLRMQVFILFKSCSFILDNVYFFLILNMNSPGQSKRTRLRYVFGHGHKRHLNGHKQTVSIRNFGHSITTPYTAPYFPSDTVTIRLFTYINGPYYCARKYGPYRSTWERQIKEEKNTSCTTFLCDENNYTYQPLILYFYAERAKHQ